MWLAVHVKLHILLVTTALAALSCQTAKLLDTWAEPKKYAGEPFRRLMIVGLGANPASRDHYENAFVDKLRAYGVVSVASINVVPRIENIDRETVEAWLSEFTLDGVIVTRVTTTKPPRNYMPPHTNLGDWYGAWGMLSEIAPGNEKFYLETDLFDASTEELHYSAVLQTKITDDPRATAHAVIDLLAKDMVKRGYFVRR